jgi:hypothetical protein
MTATASRTAISLAAYAAAETRLFGDEGSPFRAAVAPGSQKLAVVTGENASGKSLFVRIVAALAQNDELLPVSVSIRERTEGGMRKAFMFGDEQDQSTGATSVKTIATAFRNLDRPSILIVDEPELGLSDGYARALGEFIGREARTVPKKCRGVLVVTHSRWLVRGVMLGLVDAPTHVAVAADAAPRAGLQDWLDEDEFRTVDDLLALRDVGLDRWRRVNRILKDAP